MQQRLSPAVPAGAQPNRVDLAALYASSQRLAGKDVHPSLYPPSALPHFAFPQLPFRDAEGHTAPGPSQPSSHPSLPDASRPRPAQSWTQGLKRPQAGLDTFDGPEFSVPLEPPSSLKEGSSRMSPGISTRNISIPLRGEGRQETDPYLMRLLQSKATVGGRPPAHISCPAGSDNSKPAASLEAFRRIVGNMPPSQQQRRPSTSLEAPEHLLASPFSGQNPTSSMAAVPEEADAVPRQASTADIGSSQHVSQQFPPLTAPGNPLPSAPPASIHNAMALASRGPHVGMPYLGHVGGGDPHGGVPTGFPPGPTMGAHQSARPGMHDASEHMAGNNGLQHGPSSAQGGSVMQWPMPAGFPPTADYSPGRSARGASPAQLQPYPNYATETPASGSVDPQIEALKAYQQALGWGPYNLGLRGDAPGAAPSFGQQAAGQPQPPPRGYPPESSYTPQQQQLQQQQQLLEVNQAEEVVPGSDHALQNGQQGGSSKLGRQEDPHTSKQQQQQLAYLKYMAAQGWNPAAFTSSPLWPVPSSQQAASRPQHPSRYETNSPTRQVHRPVPLQAGTRPAVPFLPPPQEWAARWAAQMKAGAPPDVAASPHLPLTPTAGHLPPSAPAPYPAAAAALLQETAGRSHGGSGTNPPPLKPPPPSTHNPPPRAPPATTPTQDPTSRAAKGGRSAAKAKGALGERGWGEVRQKLLHHQEVFIQQLFDLHRAATIQQLRVQSLAQPTELLQAWQALQVDVSQSSWAHATLRQPQLQQYLAVGSGASRPSGSSPIGVRTAAGTKGIWHPQSSSAGKAAAGTKHEPPPPPGPQPTPAVPPPATHAASKAHASDAANGTAEDQPGFPGSQQEQGVGMAEFPRGARQNPHEGAFQHALQEMALATLRGVPPPEWAMKVCQQWSGLQQAAPWWQAATGGAPSPHMPPQLDPTAAAAAAAAAAGFVVPPGAWGAGLPGSRFPPTGSAAAGSESDSQQQLQQQQRLQSLPHKLAEERGELTAPTADGPLSISPRSGHLPIPLPTSAAAEPSMASLPAASPFASQSTQGALSPQIAAAGGLQFASWGPQQGLPQLDGRLTPTLQPLSRPLADPSDLRPATHSNAAAAATAAANSDKQKPQQQLQQQQQNQQEQQQQHHSSLGKRSRSEDPPSMGGKPGKAPRPADSQNAAPAASPRNGDQDRDGSHAKRGSHSGPSASPGPPQPPQSLSIPDRHPSICHFQRALDPPPSQLQDPAARAASQAAASRHRDRSPVMQPFPHPSVQPPPYSGSIAELSFARPESTPSSHDQPHGSQHTPKGPLEMPLPNGSQGPEHFQFLPGQPPRDARPCFNANRRANPSVAPGFDPMAAWYAQHYGKMAGTQAAVPHVRNRSAQEPAAEGGQDNQAGATCEAPRWWQDPKQVFGPAAVPEALAKKSLPSHPLANITGNDEATSGITSPGGGQPAGTSRGRSRSTYENGHRGGRGNAKRTSQAPPSHQTIQKPSGDPSIEAVVKHPHAGHQDRKARRGEGLARPAQSQESGSSKPVAESRPVSQSTGARNPAALQSAADILMSFSGQ